MPTSVLDVVEAYRTDLNAASRSEPFGERDQMWILFGSILQRALALPSAARAEYLRTALAPIHPTSENAGVDDHNPIFRLVETVSEDAEDAGAYALALVLLDLGRGLTPLADAHSHGRLVTRQARVHRKLGEIEMALTLYDEVEGLGLEHANEELVCRGRLGKGIVARMRGNYPAASEHFRRVLDTVGSGPAIREVKALAHHGMMIVAGVAKDYDTSLKHGWQAHDGFADLPARQADMLVEISNVCNLTGQFRAALNGYLLVLARPLAPRVRLTALGGAAWAAANLDLPTVVERLAREGEALMDARNDQYEVADLERTLAEAYYWLGNSARADGFKARAVDRARAGGYFEIEYQADALRAPAVASKSPSYALSSEAQAVTTRLAGRDSNDLLAAALSRSD
jgi:hypothetical protein